jgi:hypothetical protein
LPRRRRRTPVSCTCKRRRILYRRPELPYRRPGRRLRARRRGVGKAPIGFAERGARSIAAGTSLAVFPQPAGTILYERHGYDELIR